eukprot:6724184-Lingulodinium_polyedra.AAC.1
MALLGATYAFIERHLDETVEIWDSVRRELGQLSWIVFLAEARLGAPWLDTVFCTDASGAGFAMHVARVAPS